MPEDLGKGLYLAGAGMGLVFLALFAFFLIILALRKLFPGEEPAPEGQEVPQGQPEKEAVPTVAIEAPVAAAPQPVAPQPAVAMAGPRVAAMAVALYLAMEQEEQLRQPLGALESVPTQAPLPLGASSWSAQGRESLMANQGRRPSAYGQRSHTPYTNRLR